MTSLAVRPDERLDAAGDQSAHPDPCRPGTGRPVRFKALCLVVRVSTERPVRVPQFADYVAPRPRLLDLFCGAGGAAMGYHRAGFDVIGVDIRPQPNYPFTFIQADALEFLDTAGPHIPWNAIHASPPCQGYSTQTADKSRHSQLIEPVRQRLERMGLPYVIENVEGARQALVDPIRLCGSSFGLDLRRHRYFESNWGLTGKPCNHSWQTPRFRSLDMSMVRKGRLACVVGVHGHINYVGEFPLRCAAMGIDWMANEELVEAIPPAFTRHVGEQWAEHLALKEAAA